MPDLGPRRDYSLLRNLTRAAQEGEIQRPQGLSSSASSAGELAPPPGPKPPTLDVDLLTKLDKSADHYFIGDTDHRDMSIPEYMARPETMRTFAALGAKNLFIERPKQLQHYVDDLELGKINSLEYANGMMNEFQMAHVPMEQQQQFHLHTADMIVNANKNDIKVHCVDAQDETYSPIINPKTPEWKKHNDNILEIMSEKAGGRALNNNDFANWGDAALEYTSRLTPEEGKDFQDSFTKERTMHDGAISDNIQDMSREGKSVIFYGGTHAQSLTENLDGRVDTHMLFGKNGGVDKKNYAGFDGIDLNDQPAPQMNFGKKNDENDTLDFAEPTRPNFSSQPSSPSLTM